MKYIQKPAVVEARQVGDGAYKHLAEWCGGGLLRTRTGKVIGVLFPSPRGPVRADVGDWIIQHESGHFTMCPEVRFDRLYEVMK